MHVFLVAARYGIWQVFILQRSFSERMGEKTKHFPSQATVQLEWLCLVYDYLIFWFCGFGVMSLSKAFARQAYEEIKNVGESKLSRRYPSREYSRNYYYTLKH